MDYVDENNYSSINRYSESDKAFIKYLYDIIINCFNKM